MAATDYRGPGRPGSTEFVLIMVDRNVNTLKSIPFSARAANKTFSKGPKAFFDAKVCSFHP
jgi:hypothetical protein